MLSLGEGVAEKAMPRGKGGIPSATVGLPSVSDAPPPRPKIVFFWCLGAFFSISVFLMTSAGVVKVVGDLFFFLLL